MVTTQGNHKGLPLHQKIFVSLHNNLVVGAILYGCPESLRKMFVSKTFVFNRVNCTRVGNDKSLVICFNLRYVEDNIQHEHHLNFITPKFRGKKFNLDQINHF